MSGQEPTSQKLRLDQLLVERFGYQSRSRARDAIQRGCVSVDGKVITKAGQLAGSTANIRIDDAAIRYVSRAALKLVHAFDHAVRDGFAQPALRQAFDPCGKLALDIGASTGGFTQVLLERGASHVIAVDVGSGQFHSSLASDPRITLIENLNARMITLEDLGGRHPQMVVCDASFISLRLVLPAALELASPGAAGIFLVKPQFEAGRDKLGKGGIVDSAAGHAAARDVERWLDTQPGWTSCALIRSPISGGDGNHEYLLLGRKAAS